jgi:hypothetical protein
MKLIHVPFNFEHKRKFEVKVNFSVFAPQFDVPIFTNGEQVVLFEEDSAWENNGFVVDFDESWLMWFGFVERGLFHIVNLRWRCGKEFAEVNLMSFFDVNNLGAVDCKIISIDNPGKHLTELKLDDESSLVVEKYTTGEMWFFLSILFLVWKWCKLRRLEFVGKEVFKLDIDGLSGVFRSEERELTVVGQGHEEIELLIIFDIDSHLLPLVPFFEHIKFHNCLKTKVIAIHDIHDISRIKKHQLLGMRVVLVLDKVRRVVQQQARLECEVVLRVIPHQINRRVADHDHHAVVLVVEGLPDVADPHAFPVVFELFVPVVCFV